MRFPGILIGSWVAAGALLTLAGCSSSPEPRSGSRSTAPAPAPESLVADCATGAQLAERLSDPRITRVEVAPDCQSVAVSTGLTDEHAELALLVCESAADLAYTDTDVATVSVTGDSGRRLAAGIRDRSCAAA